MYNTIIRNNTAVCYLDIYVVEEIKILKMIVVNTK